jgi:DNA polymerase III subunit epsilon
VLFLDTETTGLGESSEVIDIAILDRDGNVLLDTLVRPSDEIPFEATGIHGIDEAAVAGAPTWDEVYPLVGRILDRAGPVVVYNADFDSRIITQTNSLYGLPDFQVEWHCAMKQFAAYAGEWHERYQNWRWQKLMTALEMMGRPQPSVQHRALTDTEASRQIVLAMAEGIEPRVATSRDQPIVPAVIESDYRQRHSEPGSEPLRPDVIRDDERERFGQDPRGWETRSGSFAGGSYTVISTNPKGCSPGLLVAILIGGFLAIGVGCCLFFVLFARLL